MLCCLHQIAEEKMNLTEGLRRTNVKNQQPSAAPIKPPDGPKSNFYPLMLEFRHIEKHGRGPKEAKKALLVLVTYRSK
jgi:hypothetical protein